MRVLIWAKLSPDELTVDLTTRSEFINQTNVFKFYRKHKDDDTIVRDTYFPNKLSCRGDALPNACLPACFMPWAAKFQCFAQSGSPVSPPGTSVFDEPVSIVSISREPFRIVYRSNSLAGGSLRCQFDRLRDDARIPTDTNTWPAESYPISGTITYEPVSGDKFQLVICEEYDLQRQSVPIGELPACALVILGAGTTLEDWDRSSEQIRFALESTCDFPNNPLALTTGRPEDDETGTIVYSGQPLWTGYFADGKWGTYPRVGNQQNLAFVSHVLVQLGRLYCIPANAIEVGSHFNMNWAFQNPWFQETYDNFFLTHPHTAFPYQLEVGIGIGDAFMVLKPISTVIGSGSRLWEVRIAGAAPLPMVTGSGTAIVCSLRYDCIEWSPEQSRYQVSWNQCGTLVNPPNPNGGFIATKIHVDGTIGHSTALRCYKLEPQTYDPLVHGTGNQIWITSAYQSTWTDEPHALDLGFDAGLQIVGPTP